MNEFLKQIYEHPLIQQLNLIRTLIDLNQNHAAVILLTDLINTHKQDFILYFLRGLALLEEGNAQDALTDFQTALKLNPDFPPALYHAGFIFVQRSQLEEGHQLFTKLKALDPDNPQVFHYLGLIAHMKNQKEKAIKYWKKALRINPSFSPAIYNLKLYDINMEKLPSLDDNLADARIMEQRRQIEAKIREIRIRKEIRNENNEIYVGQKGMVWLSLSNQKAFTFIDEPVHFTEIPKSNVKELIKILQSLIVSVANNHDIHNIFWELDFGKGQYFLYYRHKINDLQWTAYHEGRMQQKKVPQFFKFRINSNALFNELKLNGNIFLIEENKSYYLIENMGSEGSYTLYDTLHA